LDSDPILGNTSCVRLMHGADFRSPNSPLFPCISRSWPYSCSCRTAYPADRRLYFGGGARTAESCSARGNMRGQHQTQCFGGSNCTFICTCTWLSSVSVLPKAGRYSPPDDPAHIDEVTTVLVAVYLGIPICFFHHLVTYHHVARFELSAVVQLGVRLLVRIYHVPVGPFTDLCYKRCPSGPYQLIIVSPSLYFLSTSFFWKPSSIAKAFTL
ncbi:hypothetical protein CI238_07118, partial [Colletotrichum incanum]